MNNTQKNIGKKTKNMPDHYKLLFFLASGKTFELLAVQPPCKISEAKNLL